MNFEEARARADILKAMAHPIRVLLVQALSGGDRSVGELVGLADVDPSGISRHLSQLKRAGILSDRRQGMNVIYHLQTPCILRAFDCAVEVVRTETQRKHRLLQRKTGA